MLQSIRPPPRWCPVKRRLPANACARRFFLAMSIVMLAIVFAGFSRTLFLRAFFDVRALPPYLIRTRCGSYRLGTRGSSFKRGA